MLLITFNYHLTIIIIGCYTLQYIYSSSFPPTISTICELCCSALGVDSGFIKSATTNVRSFVCSSSSTAILLQLLTVVRPLFLCCPVYSWYCSAPLLSFPGIIWSRNTIHNFATSTLAMDYSTPTHLVCNIDSGRVHLITLWNGFYETGLGLCTS